MGFEKFDSVEKKYQVNVVRLTEIAVHIVNSDHDAFVRAMAVAWRRADSSNKRILMPAWEAVVVKYSLEAEAEAE